MFENYSLFEGEKPLKIQKPIRLIELFAGIGAQAKALENINADFERYKICEFDKYAVASYNAVHGTDFKTSDITKMHGSDLGIVQTDKFTYLMTYSFPCQDLSTVGMHRGMGEGSGTRSGLLWEVRRLLKETDELPQVLLMENVSQVISQRNIAEFSKWVLFLEKLGYQSSYAILNSKDFGIPQSRSRCFMVSWLGDYYFEFPQKVKLDKRLKDLLQSDVEEKYYLSDRRIKSQKAHEERNRRMGNSFKWFLTDGNGISQTVMTTPDKSTSTYIIDDQKNVRKLTPLESWRLMGFDDASFERASKVVATTHLYKQAGNSIVVNVLEAIFKQMIGKEQ